MGENIMFLLYIIGGLFFVDNAEFFGTAEKQWNEGYRWEFVGKQIPEGVPALTVKNEKTGEESIYFKLK